MNTQKYSRIHIEITAVETIIYLKFANLQSSNYIWSALINLNLIAVIFVGVKYNDLYICFNINVLSYKFNFATL